jgi:hypothetical protein
VSRGFGIKYLSVFDKLTMILQLKKKNDQDDYNEPCHVNKFGPVHHDTD